MDGGRRTTTVRQLEMLLEFAEANTELALGRLRSKEARALSTRLWRNCADSLNSEGPAQLPKEWNKIWNDLKCRVKTRLTTHTLSQRGTGGGPKTAITLTPLEERVANIIGRNIGPIPYVSQDQLLQASAEENRDVVVEYINAESNEIRFDEQLQLHLPEPSCYSLPCQSPPRPTQSTPQPTQSTPQPTQSTPQPRQSTPQPTHPTPRLTQSTPLLPSPPPPQPLPPSPPPPQPLPPSQSSTPRHRRQRPRHLPRQTTQRAPSQAQTSRGVLDENRATMMRIEELRAGTDNMLAESALRRAEAAVKQADAAVKQAEAAIKQAEAEDKRADAAVIAAEASRLQAQTVVTLCLSWSSLVPEVRHLLRSHARRGAERVSSSEVEEF